MSFKITFTALFLAGVMGATGGISGASAEARFIDEFDGDSLAGHWEVLNENLDSYIVEDGQLLVISSGESNINKGDAVNIFRLKNDLPEGDWTVTMKFSVPYQTGREAPFLAIYDDADNQLVATSNSWSRYEKLRGARLFLNSWKTIKGEKTSFSRVIWGGASGKAYSADEAPNPFLLRITKKGRSYTPAVKLEGLSDAKWIEHEKLTYLRPTGKIAFGIYQAEKVAGETPMTVDWIRID